MSEPALIPRIIRAYDDPIVRAYCWGRFKILRQRFLDEIGQYLPAEGEILDLGCGFGLFSLFYAAQGPNRRLHGIDLDGRRIQLAQTAAQRLGLANARYAVGDARSFIVEGAGERESRGRLDAAYMLDIVHHIAPDRVEPLVKELHRGLKPGGMLLVKDVDSRPLLKRWFTWALDKAMSPEADVNYWPMERLGRLLEGAGFQVRKHLMVDILPYPHVLYICQRLGA